VSGGLTVYRSVANFQKCLMFMCQKLRKLVVSRYSYCNNRQLIFWTTLYMTALLAAPYATDWWK